MTKRSIVALAAIFLCSASAQAGMTWIELVPQTPAPYPPGASLDVDVLLHNMEGQTLRPRLITLDFSSSDPSLGLPSTFSWNASLATGLALYAQFPTMPKVDIVYQSGSNIPGFMIEIPDGGSLTVGTLTVDLPQAGIYKLDAINPSAPDMNTGARIDYDFDNRITLHMLNQNLGGGSLRFPWVIPEPSTIVLLGISGLVSLGHRRRERT